MRGAVLGTAAALDPGRHRPRRPEPLKGAAACGCEGTMRPRCLLCGAVEGERGVAGADRRARRLCGIPEREPAGGSVRERAGAPCRGGGIGPRRRHRRGQRRNPEEAGEQGPVGGRPDRLHGGHNGRLSLGISKRRNRRCAGCMRRIIGHRDGAVRASGHCCSSPLSSALQKSPVMLANRNEL